MQCDPGTSHVFSGPQILNLYTYGVGVTIAVAFKLFLSQLYRALLRHLGGLCDGQKGSDWEGLFPLLNRSALLSVYVDVSAGLLHGVVQVILSTTPGDTIHIIDYWNRLPWNCAVHSLCN